MFKLLFVHPDQKLSSIYLRHLHPYFEVDSATDGLSALRKFKLMSPQAVVSDYNLPLLSGASLLRFVRNHPIYQSTPFIFLTDHHDNSEALSLGANDWLDYRQLTPEHVLERIHHHLIANRQYLMKGVGHGL